MTKDEELFCDFTKLTDELLKAKTVVFECEQELTKLNILHNDEVLRLKDSIERFKTIAYNAITFAQLDEQYKADELMHELGATKEEFLAIAEGDEFFENKLKEM